VIELAITIAVLLVIQCRRDVADRARRRMFKGEI
jgi:hypothetical protein